MWGIVKDFDKARQDKFICIAQFNDKVIQSALQRHYNRRNKKHDLKFKQKKEIR